MGKIDDPLDAAAVHFGGGFISMICGGLFGTRINTSAAYSDDQPCGAFFGCGGSQLGVNVLAAVMVMIWSFGMGPSSSEPCASREFSESPRTRSLRDWTSPTTEGPPTARITWTHLRRSTRSKWETTTFIELL